MIAKYPDTCFGCGEAVIPGQEVHWDAAQGVRCTDCGPAHPDEKRGAATAAEDVPGYVVNLRVRVEMMEAQLKRIDEQLAELRCGDVALLLHWALKLSDELGIEAPMEMTS